jgi:hypothetical protein
MRVWVGGRRRCRLFNYIPRLAFWPEASKGRSVFSRLHTRESSGECEILRPGWPGLSMDAKPRRTHQASWRFGRGFEDSAPATQPKLLDRLIDKLLNRGG